jgi:hypothetical protein
MTPLEEIMKYLKRIEKKYPPDPHGLADELNERCSLLSRVTQIIADAKEELNLARGKELALLSRDRRTATELKQILNTRTTQQEKLYTLAEGLHSDLVQAIGVGRTLVSAEKEYVRTFGSRPSGDVDERTGEILTVKDSKQ